VIEIVDPHPASEEALAGAERELGFRLPKAYRSWLAATGGGQPSDDLEIRNGVVTEFYEVEPHGVDYSLVSTNNNRASTMDSWVPRDFLVASAEAGGVVALKVIGDDIGSVWWADYDKADEIAPRGDHELEPLPEIMERLADNWTDFVMLYPEDDDGDGGVATPAQI
jgi:SMI1 / KNR4 family (SUKH-1)